MCYYQNMIIYTLSFCTRGLNLPEKKLDTHQSPEIMKVSRERSWLGSIDTHPREYFEPGIAKPVKKSTS